jgi:2,3-bisphosphoglycerate-independent phosphoglycerate mutase
MDSFDLMRDLHLPADTKIVMLVIDGLGGLPREARGPTELEAAHTPNLDALAAEAICGLSTPIFPGVTPGSGPSHLSLFGYDPLRYDIGRGVLEALGIGFDLQADDIAARGNFATLDAGGNITDRRAGRIPTEKGAQLCALLREIELPGVETFVEPVKEYRFVLVLRGQGLQDGLTETDPQRTGVPPLPVQAERPEAEDTAKLFNQWLARAREILSGHHPANGCNLRGLAKDPGLPKMQEIYGLKSAAIATYPMYKGVAKLIGMDALEAGDTLETEVHALKKHWTAYDFFYFHVKKTDSAGEDGDFDRKVHVIEHTDQTVVPAVRGLNPDVIIVTGDHSTPSIMRSHSWHPLPVIFWSRRARRDAVTTFGETACAQGALGHVHHTHLMPLAMGHAGRLNKYGA